MEDQDQRSAEAGDLGHCWRGWEERREETRRGAIRSLYICITKRMFTCTKE